MDQSVFYQMEFFLLIIFSVVLPVSIYIFLISTASISRWAVLGFALILLGIAGVDLALLKVLAIKATQTISKTDDLIFTGQVSVALYLLPLLFAGLGVNLLSHVLIDHLKEAEQSFDKAISREVAVSTSFGWVQRLLIPNSLNETWVIAISATVTLAIFILDLTTGAEIRLHVLYIFPLAAVALHCKQFGWVLITFVFDATCQIITFAENGLALPSFVTDAVVAVVVSALVVLMARMSRQHSLMVTELAVTDSLTQLANQRALMGGLQSEIIRQKRYSGVFSLAMLDLDGFKKLNDTQGHKAGDEALKLVANVLRRHTRTIDIVGRVGGDEFAILMPNTQHADCIAVLAQLCSAIAAQMATVGFAVTASVGCKTFEVSPEDSAQAIKQADDLLYQAKRAGKNQAVCA